MSGKMNVGIIGCGNICGAYLKASKTFKDIQIIACADLKMEAAEKIAEEYKIKALGVAELLGADELEIILNLTIPAAHAEINLQALKAGKHAYCEKPFALNLAEGKEVLALAKEKNLYVGCAPDTFLGGGHQTCRKIIDDQQIGRPIAGTAFMMCPGHESWHPNPAFFYQKGAGPVFDMGPYYITALINLLGPVKRVCASTSMTFAERTATAEPVRGQKIKVEVPTHIAGVMDFANGAIITIVTSYDILKHTHNHLEIYGTEGSMVVPDPNCFDGPVKVCKKQGEWEEVSLTHGYTDNMRSIGLADLAYSIKSGSPNRCSGELAYHALEVMQAFDKSSASGSHVTIESSCEKPAALPLNLEVGALG